MESWKNITLNLRGESVEIDGVGFSSIGRLELLKLLQARAHDVGVAARYETTVASVDQFAGYDLIVAADGLNSLVRRSFESEFGASVSYSTNKFAWYGTTKTFATLSQTFVKTERGSLQRPSLSLFAFDEHLPGRMRSRRPGRLTALPTRRSRSRRRSASRRLRGHARRPQADLEQIGVAQFPLDLERALVAPEHGADRRRPALGAFLDRLGHAACDRGCDRAGEGAGSGDGYPGRARALRERAQADREEAGDGRAHQRRLVREISPST